MSDWSQLMKYVLPECPGVTEMLAEQVVRQTAKEFFTQSRVIVERLADIPLVIGQRTYELIPATPETSVVQVLDVWTSDNKRLKETTFADLANGFLDWRTAVGNPSHFVVEELGTVSLFKTPDSDGTLRVSACLAPTLSASGISAALFERHASHIVSGAKAKLMAMPGMTWSNAPLSQYYQALYTKDLNETRLDGKRQYGRANQSVKLRAF